MQGILFGMFVVAQNQLGFVHFEVLGCGEFAVLIREGADDQDFLAFLFHGIHVELIGIVEMLPVDAVADTGQLLSQLHGFAVEVQNGIRVFFLLPGVKPGVVFVDADPGGIGGRETGIFFIRPLHRCPGAVPGGAPLALKPLFGNRSGCWRQ